VQVHAWKRTHCSLPPSLPPCLSSPLLPSLPPSLPPSRSPVRYEDFFLKLTTDRKAISKLGLAYAKLPGGATSLFAPSEGKMAEIVDLKVYARKGR
jgi:hypothetical protein